jgi:CDP-diacylglycerol--serine O-phosphatidyltransferase
MVSNFRYHSFKAIDRHGRVPFVAVLAVVLVFVLVSIHPSHTLFVVFAAYAVSGPVLTLVQLRRHRSGRRGQGPPKGGAAGPV